MDKILKNTALAVVLCIQIAMAQPAPVTVHIEDFKVQSFTDRYTLQGAGVRDIFLLGLLRDSTIVVRDKPSNNQKEFVISGSVSLYNTEFYCSIDITDQHGNKTKLPEIYGKHKDFYPSIDKSANDILTTIRRMRAPRKNGQQRVAVNLTMLTNTKNESVNTNVGKDVIEMYQQAINVKDNFRVYDLDGTFSGPLSYDFDSLVCLVDLQLYFERDMLVASPTMFFDKEHSLMLPLIYIDASTKMDVVRESLRKDYQNLYDYLEYDSGDFNLSRVDQLDSLFQLDQLPLQTLTGHHLTDSTEMPALLFASIVARRFKSSWNAHMLLGRVRLKYRRNQEAAWAFQNAIKQDDEQDEAYMYLGHANFTLGMFLKSIEAYKVPLAKRGNDPYFQNLGSLSMLAGKSYLSADSLKQAERLFLRSIANHPDLALAHYYLGVTENRLGKFSSSLEHLNNYLARYPGDKNARQWISNGTYRMGLLKLREEQYDSAEFYFLQARKYKANTANDLGLLYAYNGQMDFEKSDSLITKNLSTKIFDRSTVYYQHGSNLEQIAQKKRRDDPARKLYQAEAMKYLSKNVEQNGKQVNAAMALGNSQVGAGEYSKAVKSFKEALRNDPSSIEAKLNQAEALIMADRASEVEELFPNNMLLNRNQLDGADYLLMLYLRVVANQIQMDKGKKTVEQCSELSGRLEEALSTKPRIFGWSYDSFKTWLGSYQGAGKSTIETYTTRMEKRTF